MAEFTRKIQVPCVSHVEMEDSASFHEWLQEAVSVEPQHRYCRDIEVWKYYLWVPNWLRVLWGKVPSWLRFNFIRNLLLYPEMTLKRARPIRITTNQVQSEGVFIRELELSYSPARD